MKFKVGDLVQLNRNIREFKYNNGPVGYDEIGKIIDIDSEGDIWVEFPSLYYCVCLEKELVFYKKHFKALSNNFTGALEIKNGYIENIIIEILDDKEKEYLASVIRPFRDKVAFISKMPIANKKDEVIYIHFKNGEEIYFPRYKKKTMYVNMKYWIQYNLEELGL